ncbi:hypothetical protein [Niallia taxi]|uniref:hypothetical protein n=1 Tax=Niallia taxi TaxID=2499688 RepID=UPI0015F6DB6C|nr:hypothetical protein [Niallia taxi]
MALLSLVDRFEELEVERITNLSSSEKEFCLNLQTEYDQLKTFHQNYILFLNQNAIDTDLISTERLKHGMTATLEQGKYRFIKKIADYFSQQYNIFIDYENLNETLDFNVTYDMIIERVGLQLGSTSFEETAENEMRQRLNRHLLRKQYLEIKGNRISIQHYLMFHEYEEGYALFRNGGDRLNDLFSALTHFKTGVTKVHQELEGLSSSLYSPSPAEEQFKRFELVELKDCIEGFRFYKNGRIDIYFANEQLAEDFYRDYCHA